MARARILFKKKKNLHIRAKVKNYLDGNYAYIVCQRVPLGSNPSANVAIRAVSLQLTIEINCLWHTDIIKVRKFYFIHLRSDLKNSGLTEKSFQ